MRLFTIGILCLLLSCCTIEWRHDPAPPVVYTTDPAVIEVYYEICSEDPHYWMPEWCDYYDDGTTCCVWYNDTWYEEWCQLPSTGCWEYNGAWQKDLA